MSHEQQHLDALNKIISVQSDLIIYLKAEVERLKQSTIYIGPQPSQPTAPWISPYPGVDRPYQPLYPQQPPFITSVTVGVTGSGDTVSITGDGIPSLPPDSIRCSPHNGSLINVLERHDRN